LRVPTLKILLLHNRYRQPGGEDVVVESQEKLLRSKGHDVRVFEKDNHEIDGYGLLRKAALFFKTSHNLGAADEVAKLVAEFKPHVAHVHNTLPLLSPSIYAPLQRAGVKVLQYLHNYRLVCPAGTLYRDGKHCQLCVDGSLKSAVDYRCWGGSRMASLAVTRMLNRHRRARTWHSQVDLFVALNSYMRDVLVKKDVVPADKIVVQPNFTDVPGAPPIEGEGFVFSGRLSPEKGITTLLSAASSHEAFRVKVMGDWPLQHTPRVVNSPQVSFLGQLPRPEVLGHVASARALIFPSEWQEPFGLSIIEAMALSKPVIASRVAGPKDIVEDGRTGLLFEPGNARELSACMRRLHENPELAVELGTAGRERFEREYSPEAGYRRMVENYKRIRIM
jgi:glycosyltransferase involved in cell wall biosynthesis